MDDNNAVASTTQEYQVGYCKPPKDTQFKPNQSGNYRGRPPGTRNFKTDLQNELNGKIKINEGGQPQVISRQLALIKRLFELALNGNIGAINTLANLIAKHLGTDDLDQLDVTLNRDDQQILDQYLKENPLKPKKAKPTKDET